MIWPSSTKYNIAMSNNLQTRIRGVIYNPSYFQCDAIAICTPCLLAEVAKVFHESIVSDMLVHAQVLSHWSIV